MRALAIAVICSAVACGGGDKPVAKPVETPRTCPRVADHLLTLLSPTAQQAPTEELDRVRAHFTQRCEQDGWSQPAQQCFLGLTKRDEVDRCAAQLTEAQRRALEAAPAS